MKVLLDLHGMVKDLFYPVRIAAYSKPLLVSLWRGTSKERIPSLFRRFHLYPISVQRQIIWKTVALKSARKLIRYIFYLNFYFNINFQFFIGHVFSLKKILSSQHRKELEKSGTLLQMERIDKDTSTAETVTTERHLGITWWHTLKRCILHLLRRSRSHRNHLEHSYSIVLNAISPLAWKVTSIGTRWATSGTGNTNAPIAASRRIFNLP